MNTILAITYSFFLSYIPVHSVSLGTNKEVYENSTHVEFSLGVDVFDIVHVYCGEETYQVPCDSIFDFYPYRQSYLIGIEGHKKFNDSFKIKGGIKHKCTHPLNCWNKQYSNLNESKTEIYIDVSGKLNIF